MSALLTAVLLCPKLSLAQGRLPVLFSVTNSTVQQPTNFWGNVNDTIYHFQGHNVLRIGSSNNAAAEISSVFQYITDQSGSGAGWQFYVNDPSANLKPWIWPDIQGANGQTLTNDGSGNMGWWTPDYSFTNVFATIVELLVVSNQVQVASNYLFGWAESISNRADILYGNTVTNVFTNGVSSVASGVANITIGAGGGGGAGSLPFNLNQFDTNSTVSIKSGAVVSNIIVMSSNTTATPLAVTNTGTSVRTMTALNSSGKGLVVEPTGWLNIRGSASGANPTAMFHNDGANQTYTIWTNSNGGNGSFIMRVDNAGNAVFSPGNSAGATYFGGPDSGSGIIYFNLVTVGTMWSMIPSSAVAAWHGSTLRRGQLTNVWDIWSRTNIYVTRTNFNGYNVSTNDIQTINGTFRGSTNGLVLPGVGQISAPNALLSTAGAHLWSDGTNLCVVMQNAGGTRTTNKITMSAWP